MNIKGVKVVVLSSIICVSALTRVLCFLVSDETIRNSITYIIFYIQHDFD